MRNAVICFCQVQGKPNTMGLWKPGMLSSSCRTPSRVNTTFATTIAKLRPRLLPRAKLGCPDRGPHAIDDRIDRNWMLVKFIFWRKGHNLQQQIFGPVTIRGFNRTQELSQFVKKQRRPGFDFGDSPAVSPSRTMVGHAKHSITQLYTRQGWQGNRGSDSNKHQSQARILGPGQDRR